MSGRSGNTGVPERGTGPIPRAGLWPIRSSARTRSRCVSVSGNAFSIGFSAGRTPRRPGTEPGWRRRAAKGVRRAASHVFPLQPPTVFGCDVAEVPVARTCTLSRRGPCDGPLSGEHYISKSVLKHLFTAKCGYIMGVPWAADGLKAVSYEALTAKILCRRHNSALSSLDDLAGRFFGAIKEAQLALQAGSNKSTTNTFKGDALERWLLKVAFGMWSSGNLTRDGRRLEGKPPPQWGDILLGADFPPQWGLYVPLLPGKAYLSEQEFELMPLIGPDGQVSTVRFGLARMPFTLMLGRPDEPAAWGIYRPSEINLGSWMAKRTLRLLWPNILPGEPVNYYRLHD